MGLDKNVLFRIINLVFILIFAIICFITLVAVLTKNVGTNTLNEIGGAIGGITSPIVGILGAVLLYLTFEQQNRAIQQPIELEKEKLAISKKLILTDLRINLLPQLKDFREKCIEFNKIVTSNNTFLVLGDYKYTGFNKDIYNSIGVERLFTIFGEDVFELSAIYRRAKDFNSESLKEIYRELNVHENNADLSTKEGRMSLEIAGKTFSKNIFAIIDLLNITIDMANKIVTKYPTETNGD